MEEEIEGEGEEEKREWEELSERACMLIRMMEKMKNRREGKKSMSLREMKEALEEKKKTEEMMKEVKEHEEEMKKEIYRLKALVKEEGEKELEEGKQTDRKKDEDENVISVVTSLDALSVTFPQTDYIKREGNKIIHFGNAEYRHCFIGGGLRTVCSLFVCRYLLLLYSFFLSIRVFILCMRHCFSY